MSDRIGVMNKARVVQIGSPVEIYERPATYSSRHSSANPICWTRRSGSDADSVGLAVGDGARSSRRREKGLPPGQQVKLVIRPENVLLDGSEAGLQPAGGRRREGLPGRADPLPGQRRRPTPRRRSPEPGRPCAAGSGQPRDGALVSGEDGDPANRVVWSASKSAGSR